VVHLPFRETRFRFHDWRTDSWGGTIVHPISPLSFYRYPDPTPNRYSNNNSSKGSRLYFITFFAFAIRRHEIITISFSFGCVQHRQCLFNPFWLIRDLACCAILLATAYQSASARHSTLLDLNIRARAPPKSPRDTPPPTRHPMVGASVNTLSWPPFYHDDP